MAEQKPRRRVSIKHDQRSAFRSNRVSGNDRIEIHIETYFEAQSRLAFGWLERTIRKVEGAYGAGRLSRHLVMVLR